MHQNQLTPWPEKPGPEAKSGKIAYLQNQEQRQTKDVQRDRQIAKLKEERKMLGLQVEKMQRLCHKVLGMCVQPQKSAGTRARSSPGGGSEYQRRPSREQRTDCDYEILINQMMQTIVRYRLALVDLQESLDLAESTIQQARLMLFEYGEGNGLPQQKSCREQQLELENERLRAEILTLRQSGTKKEAAKVD